MICVCVIVDKRRRDRDILWPGGSELAARAVPARLGLEAPALAWPEGALAFSTLGPSQSHWNGLALAWPGFRPRLSKAVTQGLAPALGACPALTMLHCHLLSGLRNNERGKTQRQKGYFVSSYCVVVMEL